MNLIKTFRHLFIVWLLLFLTSGYTDCQDIIYKIDSTILRVNIINFDGKTIIYKLSGDKIGASYYLSRFSVDSLSYSDGRRMDFTSTRQEKGQATNDIKGGHSSC